MKKLNMPPHKVIETGMYNHPKSLMLAEQIICIDRKRLERKIGVCLEKEIIETAIKTQVGLEVL